MSHAGVAFRSERFTGNAIFHSAHADPPSRQSRWSVNDDAKEGVEGKEEENACMHQNCPLSRLILYVVNLLPPDDASRAGEPVFMYIRMPTHCFPRIRAHSTRVESVIAPERGSK